MNERGGAEGKAIHSTDGDTEGGVCNSMALGARPLALPVIEALWAVSSLAVSIRIEGKMLSF